MIGREQVIDLLLEACPSYCARWEAYRQAPEFDAELLYVHLGDFADHVVDLLSAMTAPSWARSREPSSVSMSMAMNT